MKYLTSMQTAQQLGVSKRRVNYMCQHGQVPGVVKEGSRWMIPQEYVCKKTGTGGNKPLPIGIADYKLAVSEYYYIDKTMLIAALLDYKPLVSLFLRPRRFGKSLNMDMLKVFFEKTEEDTSVYFQETQIWESGKYRTYQGKFPVVSLSFKDLKYETWAETFANMKLLIQMEYRRHDYLCVSSRLSDQDKKYLQDVLEGRIEEALLPAALSQLMYLLRKHYQQKVIVLIDEYDIPIQQGYRKGYYDQVIGFMRNFLSGGLKDNHNLERAFLTGILRVAKESIFSGLNNLNVNSVLDDRYSQFFGFTQDEVVSLLAAYGMEDRLEQVRQWYDGYHFGREEIYNPWSVLSFVDHEARVQAYWQDTGDNSVIGEVMAAADEEIVEKMYELLDGRKIGAYIDTAVVYPEMTNNPSSVFSFLLMAGYLTIEHVDSLYDGNSYGYVRIPNKEVRNAYEKEIISKLGPVVSKGSAISIRQALITNDTGLLAQQINQFLMQSVSYFDTATEGFYHGLMLGFSALLGNHYEITSNVEAGNGRYDIMLKPFDKKAGVYVMELKALRAKGDAEQLQERLEKEAQRAIGQVEQNQYHAGLKEQGYGTVIAYGMAFCQKKCAIVSREL